MADFVKIRIGSELDPKGFEDGERQFKQLTTAGADFVNVLKAGVGIDLGGKLVQSLAAVPQIFQEAIANGVRFNAELEGAKLGIAAIIKQFDATGKTTFDQALGKSAEAIELLKKKAMESPATFQQLVQGFQAVSGAATGAGIQLKDQVNLVVLMSQALAGLGIRSEQIVQESRALLTGNITEDAAAARILGITKAQVDAAREQGELYGFLSEKLSAFAEAGVRGQGTLTTALSNLEDALTQLQAKVAEPVFEALRDGVLALNAELGKPETVEALKALGFEVAEIAKGGMAMIRWAVENAEALSALAHVAGVLAVALAAMKIGQITVALGAWAVSLLTSRTALDAETAALARNTAAQAANATVRGIGAGTAAAGAAAGPAAGAAGSRAAWVAAQRVPTAGGTTFAKYGANALGGVVLGAAGSNAAMGAGAAASGVTAGAIAGVVALGAAAAAAGVALGSWINGMIESRRRERAGGEGAAAGAGAVAGMLGDSPAFPFRLDPAAIRAEDMERAEEERLGRYAAEKDRAAVGDLSDATDENLALAGGDPNARLSALHNRLARQRGDLAKGNILFDPGEVQTAPVGDLARQASSSDDVEFVKEKLADIERIAATEKEITEEERKQGEQLEQNMAKEAETFRTLSEAAAAREAALADLETEHAILTAQLAGRTAEARALERKRDLEKEIVALEKQGLTHAEATARAEANSALEAAVEEKGKGGKREQIAADMAVEKAKTGRSKRAIREAEEEALRVRKRQEFGDAGYEGAQLDGMVDKALDIHRRQTRGGRIGGPSRHAREDALTPENMAGDFEDAFRGSPVRVGTRTSPLAEFGVHSPLDRKTGKTPAEDWNKIFHDGIDPLRPQRQAGAEGQPAGGGDGKDALGKAAKSADNADKGLKKEAEKMSKALDGMSSTATGTFDSITEKIETLTTDMKDVKTKLEAMRTE